MGKSDAARTPASAGPAAGGAALRTFQIDAAHWKRFIEVIHRPAQHKPGLEKLFARPSVFGRA